MVQMGDEAHNRNRAGTLMLLRDLLPATGLPRAAGRPTSPRRPGSSAANDHFFLNLAMPACKLFLDAARDIPGSTMVVAMARNGTDFGIQVSGTGDRLVHRTGAGAGRALPRRLRPGRRQPRHRRLGDHRDRRPGRVRDGGGAGDRAAGGRGGRDALAATERMYEITLAEHPMFGVPVLEFRGTPCRHRRHPGGAHRHPAADQHRDGRTDRRHRAGRRRAGEPAGRDLPRGAGGAGRCGARAGDSAAARRWRFAAAAPLGDSAAS